MIAVCNTTPISSLLQIDQLPLLGKVFATVYLPPEVIIELDDTRNGPSKCSGAVDIGDFSCILIELRRPRAGYKSATRKPAISPPE
jgi:predicted nucleic acid-binding protein